LTLFGRAVFGLGASQHSCRSYKELREKNKEQYNAYMREYMKKYYQRKKKDKKGDNKQTPFNDTICWD